MLYEPRQVSLGCLVSYGSASLVNRVAPPLDFVVVFARYQSGHQERFTVYCCAIITVQRPSAMTTARPSVVFKNFDPQDTLTARARKVFFHHDFFGHFGCSTSGVFREEPW